MIYQDISGYLFPNCSQLFPNCSRREPHIKQGKATYNGERNDNISGKGGIQILALFNAIDKIRIQNWMNAMPAYVVQYQTYGI
jgi:hypothetical protein